MNKQEEIVKYKNLIPQRITVTIEKNLDEEGVWAKILDLPHCYTQASSINELPRMITDAVLTHFEIPEEYRSELGQFVPVSENHLKLEDMFRRLIDIQNKTQGGEEVKEIFYRAEACAF